MNQPLHVHSDALSLQQLMVLEGIACRLARKYPPDWLERQGRPLYLATVATSFLTAVVLGLAWGPWWGFLVPLCMPTCVLVLLPRLLFGRVTGRPRWAHPFARLDWQDAELLRRVLASSEYRPTVSGEEFFAIWCRAYRGLSYRHG
ncbi:hypothetical protein [Massilia sp. IC2-476]|uniref:hypothetical protein n=1 Tax=Massilia sp. IC2-476 TaxID=2887199 RepID=UPI001D10B5AA|nr:hypothetical protein [Massilia sp. IC2-476]MCC2970501.1 hypothetical protein [Massilia sp. IC2-476]